MAFDIVGIGSPLLDKTINVTESFLAERKYTKGQMHLLTSDQVQTILNALAHQDVINGAGGSVGNTLAAVASIGGKALFTGIIGHGAGGSVYEQLIESAGINSDLHRVSQEQGVCLVLVTPDGERTMLTHLGAALSLTKEDINVQAIKEAKILHVECYLLDGEKQKEALFYALQIAKDNNIKISTDLADPALIERHKEDVMNIVRNYANIIFVNEAEAEMFTGKSGEAAARVLGEMVEIAVVKMGVQGSFIASKGHIDMVGAFKVSVANTNGAGDAYAGAFLQSIIDGRDLKTAGRIAAYIAAKVVSLDNSRIDRHMKKEINMLLAEEVGNAQSTKESEFARDSSQEEKTITPSKTDWTKE